jgi:hypothetical protein
VDATAALQSIAGLLVSLPDESVEGMLVTFDALAGVSDEALRPAAAQLLRNAAGSCQDAARRERLLKAAAAVAAGQPCALTPGGLTWKQAAAAQTVTQAEWDERVAQNPLPPLPGESEAPADEEPEDEEADDSTYMEEEPPKLPHLRVRHFFPGLVVRVGRDFADAYGQAGCSGDLLKVLALDSTGDGCAVYFLERDIHLSTNVAGHEEILKNAGNAWFQPVPTRACLEDLLEAVDRSLSEVEEGDDDEDAEIERIEALREDVDKCRDWLSQSGERGPAPRCGSGRLANKVFGRDHAMTQWVPLLFAAVAVCMPDF